MHPSGTITAIQFLEIAAATGAHCLVAWQGKDNPDNLVIPLKLLRPELLPKDLMKLRSLHGYHVQTATITLLTENTSREELSLSLTGQGKYAGGFIAQSHMGIVSIEDASTFKHGQRVAQLIRQRYDHINGTDFGTDCTVVGHLYSQLPKDTPVWEQAYGSGFFTIRLTIGPDGFPPITEGVLSRMNDRLIDLRATVSERLNVILASELLYPDIPNLGLDLSVGRLTLV